MLSRLWRWARHTSTPSSESAAHADQPASESAQRQASQSGTRAKAAPPPLPVSQPSFLDELANALPPTQVLSSDDESLISPLVLEIVSYVTQKKLDPPVMPALVPRVLAIVEEPEVDVVLLSQVIQQDLAISAKLLSVANSPLFGGNVEVKTVRRAIAQLGTEQVAQVAIGLACRSSFDSHAGVSSPFAARWQRLFQHGMTCAFTAAYLAGKQDKAAQEAAFLGGLFHDVGKAVALRAIEAMTLSGRLGPLSDALLDEAMQRVHAYPGEEFYAKWTLPSALMDLCAGHHQLEGQEPVDRTFWIVALASSFDSLLTGTDASRREALHDAQIASQKLGLSDASLRAGYAETRTLGERAARMFAS
ncbi:MAG: putative signal transduction protein [Myxococcaceae bacterium]|nr:putative signal transduction protein [Myxococcaceae bacterium]